MSVTLLQVSSPAGEAVPFDMRGQPQSRGLEDTRDAIRFRRYREHWAFFVGAHWTFRRANGQQLVTANYCRMIALKKAGWLAGKGVVLSVPSALTEVTKPKLDRVWADNDGDTLHQEIAVCGAVTGDVFILVTTATPTMRQRMENRPNAAIRIQVLRPDQVVPEWNPLDMTEMTAVKIITEVAVDRTSGGMQINNAASNHTQVHKKRFIQRITPTEIFEGWEGEATERRENSLGEIPIVHIANEKVPGEFYGLSDLDGIIDLQRELNEKLTDVSDIVHAYASPVTIITGAKAKTLDKGVGAVWGGLPTDAKVFNLEMTSDLPASHKYIELILRIMFEIAGMPEGALGRIQAISNTSAAALEVQFQPLVESRDRKIAQYKPGLEKVNYLILRYVQMLEQVRLPIDLCDTCGGRIVTTQGRDRAGRIVQKKKCYLIDPQTLDFLHPDDVKLSMSVEHSFGKEVRKVKYGQIKKMWHLKYSSFWDPEPAVDEEAEALRKQEQAEAAAEEARSMEDQAAEAEHERSMEEKYGGPVDEEEGDEDE